MSKVLTRLFAPCRIFLPLAFLLLAFASAAFAQSSDATLSGTVVDPQGAVIPGVKVTITNPATGFERILTTNDSGSFNAPLLQPGNYTLLVEGQGFKRVQLQNVILNVGDQKALQVQLSVGDVNSTVDVIADPSLVKTDGSVGTVVDRQFVSNLPINGGSFQSLIRLTPGVVLTRANNAEPGQFSVNGQRTNANYFSIDGVGANIGISGSSFFATGGGAVAGFSALGGSNNLISIEGLQEFKVLTSTYAPEFGRSPGAQVSIITRSGTNQFHGTLFEYFRNEALDANDWFNNANRLKKSPLRHNDFGFVIGGPVLLPRFGDGGRQPWYNGRNRTLFFFSYEGLRLRLPQTSISEVPGRGIRETAPAQLRPFLQAFPFPNGPDTTGGLAQYNASYSDPSSLDATSIRVDHTVNKNLTLFGRYNYSPSDNIRRGGTFTASTVTTSRIKTETLTVGATWAISAAINNEFRGNYSKNVGMDVRHLDDFGGAIPPPDSILFPSFTSSERSLFTFSISEGLNNSFSVGRLGEHLQRQVNLVDNLSISAGSHQLKVGIDYRQLLPVWGPSEYSQNNIFTNLGITPPGVPPPSGTLLSGRSRIIQIVSNDTIPVLFKNLSLYAQDTWQISRRLTLTYGLRWELNPPPTGRDGKELFAMQGVDNPITLTLAPSGTPLYQTTYTNFAPRVGVAYQLSNAKGWETALRGGFGLFYDLGTGVIARAAASFPYVRVKTLPTGTPFPLDPTLAVPVPFTLQPASSFAVVVDPNIVLPRTYQWNMALEQSLGANQTVSVSYVAAAGRRLLRTELLTSSFGGLNPVFNQVQITRNAATSDYHSMQLQFTRRLLRGLQVLTSYTWSHAIDNVSSDSTALSTTGRVDPQQDRGPSDFDIRHSLNGALSYDVPDPRVRGIPGALLRNWSVDTIFGARTAAPVNITTGNVLFGAFNVVRPDLIAGVPLYINDPTVAGGRRINRAAFAIPPAGRQGTLGRNALRGFSVWQVDLALRRQFNFSERFNLQLKADVFNIFNHPNFGDPGANSTTNRLSTITFFGQSTQMLGRSLSAASGGGLNPLYQFGGPRSIQLALKVQF